MGSEEIDLGAVRPYPDQLEIMFAVQRQRLLRERFGRLKWRLWLGLSLFRLGSWVLGIGFKVTDVEGE